MGIRTPKPDMSSAPPKVGITGRVPSPMLRPTRMGRVATPHIPKAPGIRKPRI